MEPARVNNPSASASTPQDIRQKLEELARISKELDDNAKMQAAAPNFIAAEQLRKRVKELSEAQTQLITGLVNLHPDAEQRQQFSKLSNRLDELQASIKACKEIGALKELETEIDRVSGDYVFCFQTIVAELTGVPRPSGPILG
jgi:arginine/lysine/ornithine decarboxylase